MTMVRGSTSDSISTGSDEVLRCSQLKLALVEPYSPRAEATWRALEEIAAPVYFLTWGWMENWLACLPREEAPQLAIVENSGLPVGACFLRRRWLRRHGLVPSRALFMNVTGLRGYDEITLEHNALLAAHPGVSLGALVALLPDAWDELYLPACDAAAVASLASAPLGAGVHVRIDRDVANYHIDLAKVRAQGYIPLLGSSTRAQMRKAQRAAGDVTFEIARDDAEALAIYSELVELHQRSWRMRGFPGAFADPWFDGFHRRLIARRFRHGEIQLIRVRNREMTIGCLYNFISAGRVLFYQCGFGSPADRQLRPGYLCHALAIEHCAARGLDIYDLLGGDARYKQSLATDETRLLWARVQKKRLQFLLEDRAREWVKRRNGRG
jgi:CelD/BcsL family acetyltransferase involved in cellulose biosynthesis